MRIALVLFFCFLLNLRDKGQQVQATEIIPK